MNKSEFDSESSKYVKISDGNAHVDEVNHCDTVQHKNALSEVSHPSQGLVRRIEDNCIYNSKANNAIALAFTCFALSELFNLAVIFFLDGFGEYFWEAIETFSTLPKLCFLAIVVTIIVKAIVSNKYDIALTYDVDESGFDLSNGTLNYLQPIFLSNRLWRVKEVSTVINKKYSGGAEKEVVRKPCNVIEELPIPVKINSKYFVISDGEEQFVFLPDQLVIKRGKVFGAVKYEDMSIDVSTVRVIEDNEVPSDAVVVDHTWEYVNKSGEPDQRFKCNASFPSVCMED